jgi:biopolymer transport protein ExbD
VEGLAAALSAASKDQKEPVVIVSADATAAHQSVINVLDAARRAGLPRLTFAAQTADAK